MEDLTKQLCFSCDGPLAVDENGVTYCPPCKRKKQRETEQQWRNLMSDPGEFLADPSGFGDSDDDGRKD